MANPDQTRDQGGMFARKEHTPVFKDGKATGKSTVGLNDPNYVYRHYEKPSDSEHGKGRDARLARLKGFGYVHVALETDAYLILACPRAEREKREKAGREKSAKYLAARDSDGDTITIEKTRGPRFSE